MIMKIIQLLLQSLLRAQFSQTRQEPADHKQIFFIIQFFYKYFVGKKKHVFRDLLYLKRRNLSKTGCQKEFPL